MTNVVPYGEVIDKVTDKLDMSKIPLEIETLREEAASSVDDITNFLELIELAKEENREFSHFFLKLSGMWTTGYHCLIRFDFLIDCAYNGKYEGLLEQLEGDLSLFKILYDRLLKVREVYPHEVITVDDFETSLKRVSD